MSSQITAEREAYYDILEATQKGTLDIAEWLQWFLSCRHRAITATNITLAAVMRKARFWERSAPQTVNDRQKHMLNKLLDGFDGKIPRYVIYRI